MHPCGPPAAGLVGRLLRLAGLLGGCSSDKGRVVTITTRPPDADLRIDDRNVGHGPVTEKFTFDDGQTHTVTATRFGYKEATFTVDSSYDKRDLLLVLPPKTRRVTINVAPVPGIVTVDGKALSPEPVSQITTEIEFHLDDKEHWLPHTAGAERPGFPRVDLPIRWEDQVNRYTLKLEPARKDVMIATNPPGAEVFLDGESKGTGPVTIEGLTVPFDPATNQFGRLEVKAVKPGYEPAVSSIGWDKGRREYVLDLGVKSKPVRS